VNGEDKKRMKKETTTKSSLNTKSK
jgi:hypothetical protein